MTNIHYEVVIIGGGAAGISAAARLSKTLAPNSIAIIEPSNDHYYQPIWTLVGAGVVDKKESRKDTAACIPKGCHWIKDYCCHIDPEKKEVTTQQQHLRYDYLIITAGLQLDWAAIKGLEGNLGENGICSNYSYQTVDSTWQTIRGFSQGTALFTQPSTPIKCGGAPQKIMYLAEDYFSQAGLRHSIDIDFMSGMPTIFTAKAYADTLSLLCEQRAIATTFNIDLIEIEAKNKMAIFKDKTTGEISKKHYDMIHVTPPMRPMPFLKDSSVTNKDGWVDVNKNTLQHTQFDTIFSCGDCSNLPTSKTAAAVRSQVPIMVKNLLAHRDRQPLISEYDGYTSCPLVTGYGRLILAEFDYSLTPKETFPFDQNKERKSMYLLKKDILPQLYWHGMLKGRF
ncbi:MAG TPA: pyridine nucleotide-disulfide oxidoreductase [Gammaproteobacteria bacterium]|nr:pyridine nucleotide-disulfide oxidoreductase [Gammaproteobacteria bacterium]HAU06936.1 pyridine nucleotide-disulfide oxidoreductase [Gammaproteobacteria bacterium]